MAFPGRVAPCTLRVAYIDSAPDRMCLKVRQGKGGKDRYTLVSARMLETRSHHWCIRVCGCFLIPQGASGRKFSTCLASWERSRR